MQGFFFKISLLFSFLASLLGLGILKIRDVAQPSSARKQVEGTDLDAFYTYTFPPGGKIQKYNLATKTYDVGCDYILPNDNIEVKTSDNVVLLRSSTKVVAFKIFNGYCNYDTYNEVALGINFGSNAQSISFWTANKIISYYATNSSYYFKSLNDIAITSTIFFSQWSQYIYSFQLSTNLFTINKNGIPYEIQLNSAVNDVILEDPYVACLESGDILIFNLKTPIEYYTLNDAGSGACKRLSLTFEGKILAATKNNKLLEIGLSSPSSTLLSILNPVNIGVEINQIWSDSKVGPDGNTHYFHLMLSNAAFYVTCKSTCDACNSVGDTACSCSSGKYKNTDGLCTNCPSRCSECIATNGAPRCLSCRGKFP